MMSVMLITNTVILSKRIVKFTDVAATMTPVFALGVLPVMCEVNACLRKVMCIVTTIQHVQWDMVRTVYVSGVFS